MTRGKRVLILVVLGLVTGFAQTFAGQSAEQAQDQAAQPSKNLRVDRVWVEEELVEKASGTAIPGQLVEETVRPLPGSSFVLVEFVLLAKEATTSPVLVDSEGTRHMPIGVSPYSATTDFQFLVPKFTGQSKVLQRVKGYRSIGGKGEEVDVTKDETTGQLTIKKVAEPGAKFTAVWTVPKDVLVRCSEFKLHFGEAEPLVIDTLELRKEWGVEGPQDRRAAWSLDK